MKGDDSIKTILKFIGTGINDNYQVNLEIYDKKKKIISSKTYNGEICLLLEKNKIYKMKYSFLNRKKYINFYTNSNKFIFNLNNNILNRTITLSLKDYYYNIPIEKGEIILWQK